MLLIDVTGLSDLPIPTLVDRFLMVEDWAQEAKGTVVVAMVEPPEYIHPSKFGAKAGAHFGLICDVYSAEDDALKWLLESATHAVEATSDVRWLFVVACYYCCSFARHSCRWCDEERIGILPI
jgi:hypothetical protein